MVTNYALVGGYYLFWVSESQFPPYIRSPLSLLIPSLLLKKFNKSGTKVERAVIGDDRSRRDVFLKFARQA